ncbi:MAG TPA: L,D-transpeptidase family protein [Bacillales bacterium]|nr:L,D-transpeptidase family protein [Bacillales bacterium]
MKLMRWIIPFLLLISLCLPAYAGEKVNTELYVNLLQHRLYLIKDGKTVATYPVAPGTGKTPTPIGHFKVVKKSKHWGSGFGSRWLGLNVPWGQYGIHGTNRPYLIGKSVSHGCIRMRNQDVEKLFPEVPVGTPVFIDGPIFGTGKYAYRNLSLGSKGTVVMLFQNHLRAAGYYDGPIDGIYGQALKEAVEQYQKDHDLPVTGGIKMEMYREMGFLE